MSELFVQKSIDDGDLDIALNYLDENYQELQYISDLYRSIIYQTEGNYCKALEYGKRAEAASRNVDQYYCDCSHIAMAYAYLKLGELNNAELCINKAHDDFEQMEIVESPNTIYWLRTMHQIIAGIYGLTGRYSESIKALEYGLKLTLQMKTDTVLPGIYNNLGFANMLTGHLDMAHDFYYMALDVCERIQNDYLKYYPQSNLGNYYFIRGEIEKAERFHDDALHLALKLNHSGNIVSQFRDLSQIYRIKGENARSLEYLQKSLEIAKKIGNQGTLASILVLLVDESLEIGNSDDADQYYQTLLEVSHHQDSTKII